MEAAILTTETTIPTREQVEKLKRNWRDDPNWDLYDTEGFEAYRDELTAYQAEWEAKCQVQEEERKRLRPTRQELTARLLTLPEQIEAAGGAVAGGEEG